MSNTSNPHRRSQRLAARAEKEKGKEKGKEKEKEMEVVEATEIFTLGNGAQVQLKIRDAFQPYELIVMKEGNEKEKENTEATEIFTLASGAEMQWKIRDAFQPYELIVIRGPNKEKHGQETRCGNPWNWMTEDEATRIRDEQPQTKPLWGLSSMMYHKIIPMKELGSELADAINGDVWGVFTTTADRKKITQIYYDAYNAPHTVNRSTLSLVEFHKQMNEDCKEVVALMERDCKELVDDVEKGLTVVLVYGYNAKFLEDYFFKVGDMCLSVRVDHTLDW